MSIYQHELDNPETNFQFRILAELDLKDKSNAEIVDYIGELWKQLYSANEVQRKIIQGRWDNYTEAVIKESALLRGVS
jgi:hypothetical protein